MATETKRIMTNEWFARGYISRFSRDKLYNRLCMGLVVKQRRSTIRFDVFVDENVRANFKPGDRVAVKGYVRGFFAKTSTEGVASNILDLIAVKVERDKPELLQRFGIDTGRCYQDPVFWAVISGKLIEVVPPRESHWADLVVETCSGGNDIRPSRVSLRYYVGGRLPVYDYREGDWICARLSLYVRIKRFGTPENPRIFVFNDLNVEDIAYLSRAQQDEAARPSDPMSFGLTRGNLVFSKRYTSKPPEETPDAAEDYNTYSDSVADENVLPAGLDILEEEAILDVDELLFDDSSLTDS